MNLILEENSFCKSSLPWAMWGRRNVPGPGVGQLGLRVLALLLVFDLRQVPELRAPCVRSRGTVSPCLGVVRRIRGQSLFLRTSHPGESGYH